MFTAVRRNSLVQQFIDAVKSGEFTSALELLQSFHNFPKFCEHNPTALAGMLKCAAKHGFVAGCKEMLQRVYDTSLFYGGYCVVSNICRDAFLSGNLNLANTLLDASLMDVENRDQCLHSACAAGNLEQVKAILYGNPQIVSILNQGKNIGVGLCTPLQIAVICGHLDIVSAVYCRKKYTTGNIEAFHYACASGRMDIIQFFLNHEKDGLINALTFYPHSMNSFDNSLHAASEYGRLEVIKLLLLHSESLATTTNSYALDSVLEPACRRGHTHIVRYLLLMQEEEERGGCQLQANMLQHTYKLDRQASRLCCAIMGEFGLSIIDNAQDSWEFDWLQLVEYDCLAADMITILSHTLFFDNNSRNSYSNVESDVNIVIKDWQLDFRALLSAGMLETAMSEHIAPPATSKEQEDLFVFNTHCDELWALVEMGMFDAGSIFFDSKSFYLKSISRE